MFLAKSTDWMRLITNVLGAIISVLLTHTHTCSIQEAVFTSVHKVPRYIQTTRNRNRNMTSNSDLECFVHRVSTIVLRVSCIV